PYVSCVDRIPWRDAHLSAGNLPLSRFEAGSQNIRAIVTLIVRAPLPLHKQRQQLPIYDVFKRQDKVNGARDVFLGKISARWSEC
ncbi:unnamed protein product, partial [Heterotrigona itama]